MGNESERSTLEGKKELCIIIISSRVFWTGGMISREKKGEGKEMISSPTFPISFTAFFSQPGSVQGEGGQTISTFPIFGAKQIL